MGHLSPCMALQRPFSASNYDFSGCLASLCIKHINLCSVTGIDLPHPCSKHSAGHCDLAQKDLDKTQRRAPVHSSAHMVCLSPSNDTKFFKVVFSYFWLCWGLQCCVGLPLAAASRGCSATAMPGLIFQWPLSFRPADSECEGCRGCGTWAELLRCLWALPRSRAEPLSPAFAPGFFTTEPSGSLKQSTWLLKTRHVPSLLCKEVACETKLFLQDGSKSSYATSRIFSRRERKALSPPLFCFRECQPRNGSSILPLIHLGVAEKLSGTALQDQHWAACPQVSMGDRGALLFAVIMWGLGLL